MATYWNSIDVPFQFDDNAAIVDNPAIRHLEDPLRVLTYGEPARPLLNLSFALNYRLNGLDPRGYHAVNLALHIANAALLVVLVCLLARRHLAPDGRDNEAATFALIAGLLFAVHPVNTESVTYIWGRSGVLCALFYLTALILFVAAHPQNRPARAGLYWASLGCFVAALASKATALSLPLLLLVIDYLFLSRGSTRAVARSWVGRHAPFVIVALVRCAFELRDHIASLTGLQPASGNEPLLKLYDSWPEGLDLLTNLWTQIGVFTRALGTLFYPLNLNVDHDVVVSRSWQEPTVIAGSALLVAWLGGAVWLRRREPWLAFAMAWIVVSLVFFFAVPLRDAFVERRMYLPSAGFAIGAVVALIWASDRIAVRFNRPWSAPIALLLGCVIVIGATSTTIARNRIWMEPAWLWQDASTKSPHKVRPLINLSVVQLRNHQYRDALAIADKAIALAPGSGPAHLNRVDAYRGLGAHDAAASAYVQALQAHPAHATAWLFKHFAYLGPARPKLRSAIEDMVARFPELDAEVGIALGLIAVQFMDDKPSGLRLLCASLARLQDKAVLDYYHRRPLRELVAKLRSARMGQ